MTDAPRHIVVVAKAPAPGMSKTRLVGLLSPDESARIAEACIIDTLRIALAVPRAVVTLALEGTWQVPDSLHGGHRLRTIRQRGSGLAERIEHAFADALAFSAAPTVLIAADSPQMRPSQVEDLFTALEGGADAVLGPAPDGGFWALGMTQVEPTVVQGVPMSTDRTGAVQLERLRDVGMRVWHGVSLRDIDTFEDAAIIRTHCANDSQFARTWDELMRRADRRTDRYTVAHSPV